LDLRTTLPITIREHINRDNVGLSFHMFAWTSAVWIS